MAKKVNITTVEATENGFKVTYETGSVKKYAADKLPKTVLAWIEANQEPETEPEQETTTELTTTEEPETKHHGEHYERELLRIRKEREKRDIFRNLETTGLIVLGVGYLITAAIITALASGVIWIAEHIPAMVKATKEATATTAAAISTTIEIVEDTAKAFVHMGRKAATVAAAALTMVMR